MSYRGYGGSSSYGTSGSQYRASPYGAAAPGPFASRYGTTAGLPSSTAAGRYAATDRGGYTRSAQPSASSQGVPPPAGQEANLRDRWHGSSTSGAGSADRLGQQSAPHYSTSQYSPTRPTVRDRLAREQAENPAPKPADTKPYQPYQQSTYAPRFQQAAPTSVADGYETRDRYGLGASSASDRYGGRYTRPSTAGPAMQRADGGGSQRGEAARTAQRTVYRPSASAAPTDPPPQAINAPPAPAPAPQKSKAELAAERQRKIDSKREQVAKSNEDGSSETLALDMGGQCHQAKTVVNETPFAVDNSGRCHPSPVRARPTPSADPSDTPIAPFAVDNSGRCHPSPTKLRSGSAAPLPPRAPAPAPSVQQTSATEDAGSNSECMPANSDGSTANSEASAAQSEVSAADSESSTKAHPLMEDGENFCDEVPMKGSVHIYRGGVTRCDEERVTVMSVHRDDVEPYFTIRMPDGREKQTVGSRLSPVIKCKSLTCAPASQPAAPVAAAADEAVPQIEPQETVVAAKPELSVRTPEKAPVEPVVAQLRQQLPPVEQEAHELRADSGYTQGASYGMPSAADARSHPSFNSRVEQEMAHIMAGGSKPATQQYANQAPQQQYANQAPQQQYANQAPQQQYANQAPQQQYANQAPQQQYANQAPQQYANQAPQQYANQAPQQYANQAPQQYAMPDRIESNRVSQPNRVDVRPATATGITRVAHAPRRSPHGSPATSPPADPMQQLAHIQQPDMAVDQHASRGDAMQMNTVAPASAPASPTGTGLQLSDDRNTRIQQLSDHLAMLKKTTK